MKIWVHEAVTKIEADYHRSADTHLLKLNLGCFENIDIYLKDESTHPTGSLKHRLARSLFLYALCNGHIHQGTTIVEASSGSTAVSEAYFAKMIGVPFIAVLPKSTAKSKLKLIELHGGHCHFVDTSPQMHIAAVELAASIGGYFMDQFTYAERATDWRGNNNIAQSLFGQMEQEQYPIPAAIVMSAGTGGTSATLGRYIRYRGFSTQLTVVDPEGSVFYDSYIQSDRTLTSNISSRIEGIGRPKVEHSFQPNVIDSMMRVPDAASVATILWLQKIIGRKAGGSTGTNMWGALQIAERMQAEQQSGSIVTLMCDSGERYLDTYYTPSWVQDNIGDLSGFTEQLAKYS